MRKTHTGNEFMRDADGELIFGLLTRKNIKSQAVTVGTTATKLPTTPLDKRISIIIFNNSTKDQILYIGNSSVTTTAGYPLYPRAALQIAIEDDVDVYGISSAAGANIRILEGA